MRVVDPLAIRRLARHVPACEKGHRAQARDGRLGPLLRAERTVLLLLRGEKLERLVDDAVQPLLLLFGQWQPRRRSAFRLVCILPSSV